MPKPLCKSCRFDLPQAQLAQQIYNYVDERIRVTDAELRTFGNELARERKKLGLPPVVDVAGDLAGIAGSRKQSKAKQKREAEVAAAAVAPPDGVGSPSLPLLLPVQGAFQFLFLADVVIGCT